MLTGDEPFQATTFHVTDLEVTTPRGHRPEPIEDAVISLRVLMQDSDLAKARRTPQFPCGSRARDDRPAS